MPLSERVRTEIFIPDPPDRAYRNLLEELATELSYSFGGSTTIPAFGKYRASDGQIISDKINLLFSDAPFRWELDRLALGRYVDWVKQAAQQALAHEEVVMINLHSVCHFE